MAFSCCCVDSDNNTDFKISESPPDGVVAGPVAFRPPAAESAKQQPSEAKQQRGEVAKQQPAGALKQDDMVMVNATPATPAPIAAVAATPRSQAVAPPADVVSPKLEEAGVTKGSDQNQFVDWDISLSKGGNSAATLGVAFTFYHHRLAVVQDVLANGIVHPYNEKRKGESSEVRKGDILISVNDAVGDTDKMFTAYKEAENLTLKFRRVAQFEAVLKKPTNLGLEMRGNSVEIAKVATGNVKNYNKKCELGFQILPGDRIMAVNGSAKSPDELADFISNGISADAEELRLLVARSRS